MAYFKTLHQNLLARAAEDSEKASDTMFRLLNEIPFRITTRMTAIFGSSGTTQLSQAL
jgi:uncharacterized membrane protein